MASLASIRLFRPLRPYFGHFCRCPATPVPGTSSAAPAVFRPSPLPSSLSVWPSSSIRLSPSAGRASPVVWPLSVVRPLSGRRLFLAVGRSGYRFFWQPPFGCPHSSRCSATPTVGCLAIPVIPPLFGRHHFWAVIEIVFLAFQWLYHRCRFRCFSASVSPFELLSVRFSAVCPSLDMSLCVCPAVGLAVSIFVALVIPVASVSLGPFRPFFVVPSNRVCPIRPVRCCSSKRYLVAVPVSLWLLFGHSGLLRPLQSLRLYFGHSDHLCRHLYGSASSSPSVVFRSNPAGCLTLSLVVVRLLRPLRAIFDRSGRFRRCPAPSGTVRPLVVWLPLPCVVCPRPSQYDPFQSSV